ncbi:MAG: lytic transglycosylase domain-containing protein, partial [Pseudomonadota bacterium]
MKRYEFLRAVALALWAALPMAAAADGPGTLCSDGTLGPRACIRPAHAAFDICQHIQETSRLQLLDPGFFARLLWQESRFDANALSPAGAQGIAQFMPGTAKMVGLADPWDPRQAIPASAAHLADLRRAFGNWGLAAAGYNAGAGRVQRWLAGRSGLPYETRAYVQAVTGQPAEAFRKRATEVGERPLAPRTAFIDACSALPVMRTRSAGGGVRLPWGVQ